MVVILLTDITQVLQKLVLVFTKEILVIQINLF